MAESAQDVRRMALGVLSLRLMDSRQLMDEFRLVLERDHLIRHTQVAAHARVNQNKNRYSNVLPYDHNRVLLRPCTCDGVANGGGGATAIPATGGGSDRSSSSSSPFHASASTSDSDYINASHVVHEDEQCGFSVRYIASQGPLPATEADFWRMCWSERVGAVVMLTNPVERGVNKCSSYQPTQPGTRLVLRSAGGGGRSAVKVPASCVEEVVAVSSNSLLAGELKHTVLRLTCGGGGGSSRAASRDLDHLHFTAWPDHGTPANAAAICTLCDMVEPVRAAGGAVVVHCSAGIGRTGTFCAIDILRRRLAHLEACAVSRPGSVGPDAVQAALNLPELVHALRGERSGMVQTIEQFAFCYTAVYEELLEAVGGGGGGRGGTGTPPRHARW